MPRKLRILYSVNPDPAALASRAAQYFVDAAERAAAARGRTRIAISGGSTPKATFELLAGPAGQWLQRMPWGRLDLYWVDERCVPPSDPDSNYRMTREAMLEHVPLAPAHVHRIEGELEPGVAAARYEAQLRNSFRLEGAQIPCFDLIQLGMGPDGHTASLFPHSAALHELARLVAANHVAAKDAWRITLTWPVINHAADVFFLVAGEDKARILKEVLLGPRDVERLPSQLIAPANGILTLLLDEAAAQFLPASGEGGMGTIERI